MIFGKGSRMVKEKISGNKGGNHLSPTSSNAKNTKNLMMLWLKKNIFLFENGFKKLPKHSEDSQFKDLKHALNSMNFFFI